MKFAIILVLMFATALIPLFFLDVSAKCIHEDDHCYGIPGFSPLKEQLELHTLVSNIKCPNQEHVLVERPNGKLACVTNYTAHKMEWFIHHYAMPDSKGDKIAVNQNIVHLIPFETTGLILQDLLFENNSLIATVQPQAEYGVLSLYIPDNVLDLNPQACYSVNNHAPAPSYVVVVNEKQYHIGSTVNFWGDPVLNIHTTQNAKLIEIIGICKN